MSSVTPMQELQFTQSLKDTELIISALQNFFPGFEDDEHLNGDDIGRVQELIEMFEVRRETIKTGLRILKIPFPENDIESECE